jgi:hypothetical protein
MYTGRYINLDRSVARRATIDAGLSGAGVAGRYERFAGIDGVEAAKSRETTLRAGYLGNWLSHEGVLAERRGSRHLHIIEDDASLPPLAASMFDEILRRADCELGSWDLLFTDTAPSIETRAYVALAEHVLHYPRTKRIGFVPLKQIDFAGMASLFVNGKSIGKYREIIAGRWSDGVPIDLFLRDRVHEGTLVAYVTAPFLTTISLASSESEVLGQNDFSREVMDLYRRAFYIGADSNALLAQLKSLVHTAQLPPLSSTFLMAHAAAMSDKWNTF